MRGDTQASTGAQARTHLLRESDGTPRHMRVAVVGSGFGGLCMAIKLKQAGIQDFAVLERGSSIGGTWRDNTYPGCACDVPSHLYSYSFEPEPNWTHPYARQPQIRAYIERCADKYELRPHVQLGATLSEARFDEQSHLWRCKTAEGDSFSTDILVSATGGLSNPLLPKLPGLELFEGPKFHSAQWDHSQNLAGKRVAIIGTGASTIQFLPHVARDAQHVTLFQRTPPWVMPKHDKPFSAFERFLFRSIGARRKLRRLRIFMALEMVGVAFRRPNMMRLAALEGVRHIREHIKDPALARQLTPTYTPGCKRVLLSNDYYPALARPNVDVESSPIAELRAHSILTRDGREVAADAIVFGTGFDVHSTQQRHRVEGRNGAVLGENGVGKQAYLGTMIAGFPNFFMLAGPNAGLGHNSMIFILEGAVRQTMKALALLEQRGANTVEVRADAQVAYNEGVQKKLAGSVWNTGCASWYLDETGKNITIWPGSAASYAWATRKLNVDHLTLT